MLNGWRCIGLIVVLQAFVPKRAAITRVSSSNLYNCRRLVPSTSSHQGHNLHSERCKQCTAHGRDIFSAGISDVRDAVKRASVLVGRKGKHSSRYHDVCGQKVAGCCLHAEYFMSAIDGSEVSPNRPASCWQDEFLRVGLWCFRGVEERQMTPACFSGVSSDVKM